MPSALNTARGMGKIPKPLLCLTPGHTPTLTLCKELARPPSRSEQARELLVCSHYSCCSRGPNKALPGGEKKTIMTSHHIQNKSQYPYNGFSSVQLLSCVRLFVNQWTVAHHHSAVHGISQASIQEWVAISFSRGSSQPNCHDNHQKNPYKDQKEVLFQFSCSIVSNSLQTHEPQHARPPCPSPTPRVHPNPCPLSQ